MVHATTFPAYSKDHVFVSRPTCVRYIVITLSFQNLLCSSLVTITVTVSSNVTDVTVCDCDITSNPNPKFKMKKEILNEKANVQV